MGRIRNGKHNNIKQTNELIESKETRGDHVGNEQKEMAEKKGRKGEIGRRDEMQEGERKQREKKGREK